MIPSLGVNIGPVLLLAATEVVFGKVCHSLFFTWFLDRNHLAVRRNAAIADLSLAGVLSALAFFAPYESEDGGRCTSALRTYGFATDTLGGRVSSDVCEFSGQLLVMFGCTTLLFVAMLVSLWWWAGDS